MVGSGGCERWRTAGVGRAWLTLDFSSKNGMSGRSSKSLAKAKFWAMPGRSGKKSGSSKSGRSPRSLKKKIIFFKKTKFLVSNYDVVTLEQHLWEIITQWKKTDNSWVKN